MLLKIVYLLMCRVLGLAVLVFRGDRAKAELLVQARSLVFTRPDDLRARFARHTAAALVAETALLRPRPGDVVGYATRIALRELRRRAEFPGGQLCRLDEIIIPLVTSHAPGYLTTSGRPQRQRRWP